MPILLIIPQSFAQAIALGADMIETDIRVTWDKVPVIHHDKNTFGVYR